MSFGGGPVSADTDPRDNHEPKMTGLAVGLGSGSECGSPVSSYPGVWPPTPQVPGPHVTAWSLVTGPSQAEPGLFSGQAWMCGKVDACPPMEEGVPRAPLSGQS